MDRLESRAYIGAGGRAPPLAVGPPPGRSRRSAGRPPRACETCSISTPSFSWRWQFSFSCACAACSASAPAASGRPTIPIPRASRSARPRRQGRGAARPRAGTGRAEAGRTGARRRALEGHRRAGLARSRPVSTPSRAPTRHFDAKHFLDRRARGLRDDRHRLRRGRPPQLKNLLVARGL